MFLIPFICPARSYGGDNRLEKRFGIYLSVFGDPFVSYLGVNAAYNLNDFLRVTGGVGYAGGTNISVKSLSVGIKALLPHAEFSPILGLNLSSCFANINDSYSTYYNTFNNDTTIAVLFLYSNFGFDYQAKDGFELGLGVTLLPLYGYNVFPLPYLNIGKFF
jgi:hypothetical protein